MIVSAHRERSANLRTAIAAVLTALLAACDLNGPTALHAQTNPRVVVHIAKTALLVGDSTTATGTAYDAIGRRSTGSVVTWRGNGLMIRPDVGSNGQRVTVFATSSGSNYLVAIWKRSDGKILADSVAVTVSAPAPPPPLAPAAIWYEDFQRYTSIGQITAFCSGLKGSAYFFTNAPNRDGNCSNEKQMVLDATGGPNGSKALRYDWPARPTCPAGPTNCSYYITLQPRFNPLPPSSSSEIWLRFTDKLSPNFRIGGAGAVSSQNEYKYLFLDFFSGGSMGQLVMELDNATAGLANNLVVARFKIIQGSNVTATDRCLCQGGGNDVSLPADFFGAWNTWVMGVTGIGSPTITWSIYRNGQLFREISGPFFPGKNFLGGQLTIEMGANINNGPDVPQSRWWREISVWRSRPNLAPLVTP